MVTHGRSPALGKVFLEFSWMYGRLQKLPDNRGGGKKTQKSFIRPLPSAPNHPEIPTTPGQGVQVRGCMCKPPPWVEVVAT